LSWEPTYPDTIVFRHRHYVTQGDENRYLDELVAHSQRSPHPPDDRPEYHIRTLKPLAEFAYACGHGRRTAGRRLKRKQKALEAAQEAHDAGAAAKAEAAASEPADTAY
jgi:hypothetical protein